ncbi:MAG: NAD(P)H-dependent oxidoreductase subunit [Bacillota bacterium]|jgi:NADH-quinone oxidoreductase subunit E|nr:NAD(P)H-dependent oxidoreductase subunit [Bacillota bacterium]
MSKNLLNVNQHEEIDTILKNHDMSKHNLVGILLGVQALSEEHYITKEQAEYISEKLNIFVSNVYDVITFYSALSNKPKGKYVIQVCNSTCCKVTKYENIKKAIEQELGIGIGNITPDGMFSFEYSSCFGACDISPAIRIGEKVYGNLDESKVVNIIKNYRGE